MPQAECDKFVHAAFDTIDSLHGAMTALATGADAVKAFARTNFGIVLDDADAQYLIDSFKAAKGTKLSISNLFIPNRAC